MNRQPSVKTISDKVEPKPVISPLEKAFRSIAKPGGGKGLGLIDRQTLQVCTCYRDSVKFSVYALGGVFVLSVNRINYHVI